MDITCYNIFSQNAEFAKCKGSDLYSTRHMLGIGLVLCCLALSLVLNVNIVTARTVSIVFPYAKCMAGKLELNSNCAQPGTLLYF